ncbi:MAG TPA: gluconokinase [Deltaproteobacteria bacterium]|nr:gluconokinase [Deltaproteobacteria bacterium]
MAKQGLVEYMMDKETYPDKPGSIRLIQTHISWVFVGDNYVYKVKKPVDFGFLDFTTLEKRKYYVNEEFRLNRRFSPDVYLDVVPISYMDERFVLGDDSHVVEYALKMRRLSEEKMLYRLLENEKVTVELMARIGRHLSDVYSRIESNDEAKAYGTLDTIYTNVKENFEQTLPYIGGPVSKETYDTIKSWSMDFMENNAKVFENRLSEGHIKDCHGDLHAQHICVEDEGIVIFDCIEFNKRFRFGDVASDIAFLAMDLDYGGYTKFSRAFVDAYRKASKDEGLDAVLKFYKVYRAYVRAKVTSFLLDDENLENAQRQDASMRAKAYYDLALSYVRSND